MRMSLLEMGVYIKDLDDITPKEYREKVQAKLRVEADEKYRIDCAIYNLAQLIAIAFNKPSELSKNVPEHTKQYYTKDELLYIQMMEAVNRAESRGVNLEVDIDGPE